MALIEPYADMDALVKSVTDVIVHEGMSAGMLRGIYTLALCGGRTPQQLYRNLAQEPFRTRLPWRQTHVFFTDERCVPPDHPDSNYKLLKELLLDHVPIDAERIHRMRGEDPDPVKAAADYEKEIRAVLAPVKKGEYPVFDLVLLGMGKDAHVASLFPYHKALHDIDRWVISEFIDEKRGTRITLSPQLLNNARSTLMLVTGEEKARALMAVIEGPEVPDSLPAQRIAYGANYLRWMVDREALSMMSGVHLR